MVLYIEYIILDNMVIDYLILKLLSITYKQSFSRLRLLFSCLIGTISAFLLPYMPSIWFVSMCYRIIVASGMLGVLSRYKGFRGFMIYLLTFIGYTAMLGGIIVMIFNSLNISHTISGVLYYNMEVPFSIFILIILASLWLMKIIIFIIRKPLKISNYMYNITLEDNLVMINTRAFLDSGNSVERGGEAVTIISMTTFLRLHEDVSIASLIAKDNGIKRLRGVEYLKIDGLENGREYLSFIIDKIKIGERVFNDQRVAVAMKDFKDFDCILHSCFLEVL